MKDTLQSKTKTLEHKTSPETHALNHVWLLHRGIHNLLCKHHFNNVYIHCCNCNAMAVTTPSLIARTCFHNSDSLPVSLVYSQHLLLILTYSLSSHSIGYTTDSQWTIKTALNISQMVRGLSCFRMQLHSVLWCL